MKSISCKVLVLGSGPGGYVAAIRAGQLGLDTVIVEAKKLGGIGTHVTAITKRRFFPNLQRVKVLLPSGEVRYMRVAASAIKKGSIVKAPKRNWKKPAAKA